MSRENILSILKRSNGYKVNYVDVESEVNKDFVKELRKKLNMSQSVFASVLGVTNKTIEKWEQGKNPIKGCSARLLYLINKNEELIGELYQAKAVNLQNAEYIVNVAHKSTQKIKFNFDQNYLKNNYQNYIYSQKENSFDGLCNC